MGQLGKDISIAWEYRVVLQSAVTARQFEAANPLLHSRAVNLLARSACDGTK